MRILVLLAALGLSAGSLVQTIEAPAEVVIRGVSIVDVMQGRLVPAQDIVVRGTRIERIGPAGSALPPAKTLIEGRGKVAMPGLIDAPVRLGAFSPPAMQGLLALGITTVQDTGTDAARLGQWRRDLNSGRLYAPRIAQGCVAAPAGAASGANASPDVPDAIHRELARLVSSERRRPADALRLVTLDRARALCLDGGGAIAAGAPADLVVLSANPLDDIRHTRAIDAVVFRGEVFTQAHVQMLRRGTLPLPTPTP